MSITTYQELQTSVANWLSRDDLTSIIPDLITIGEKRIFREVRCRVMETTLTGTTSSGVIAVPSDYLAIKFAYISGTPVSKLARMSASQLYERWPLRTATGLPVAIAREGANFIFGPFPVLDYTIGGIYYAKPTVIATSANALFLANPDLYLFSALCEAAPYLKDDQRAVIWEGLFATGLANLILSSEAATYGGSGLRMKTKR